MHVSASTNMYRSEQFNVQSFKINDNTSIDTRVFSAILIPPLSYFFSSMTLLIFNEKIIKYQ